MSCFKILVYVGISTSFLLYIVVCLFQLSCVGLLLCVLGSVLCSFIFHLLFLRWCFLFFLRAVVLVTVSLVDVFRLSVGVAFLLLLLFLLGVPIGLLLFFLHTSY
jgi:hypothetical protein